MLNREINLETVLMKYLYIDVHLTKYKFVSSSFKTLLTVEAASLKDNEGKTVMHLASEQGQFNRSFLLVGYHLGATTNILWLNYRAVNYYNYSGTLIFQWQLELFGFYNFILQLKMFNAIKDEVTC